MRAERRRWLACGALLAGLASGARADDAHPLVPLGSVDPDIATDIRYAGDDNFVGEPVDGYEAARCLLTPQAAEALSRAQARLRAFGLGLLVFDCYRPRRAVAHFVRWSKLPPSEGTKKRHHPNLEKEQLLALGYIAPESSHSRGSTVDLTLVEIHDDGHRAPLDMGTPFDFFDARSHTASPAVPAAARAHRLLLLLAMESAGFRNFVKEWWHYTLGDEPYPERSFDVPVR